MRDPPLRAGLYKRSLASVIYVTFSDRSPPGGVGTEHPNHFGHPAKVVECAGDIAVVVLADEIEIKRVLPRPSLDRPRLDFRQIDFKHRKRAEGAEERPRLVRRLKHDGSLPPARGFARHDVSRALRRGEQKKA